MPKSTSGFRDIIEKQDGIWVELKTLPEGTWFRKHNDDDSTLIYIKGQERTRKITCPCCTCDKHKTKFNAVAYWCKVFGKHLKNNSIIDGDDLVYIPKTFPNKFLATIRKIQ